MPTNRMPSSSTNSRPLVEEEHISRLREILGDDNVITDPVQLADPEWPLKDPYWVQGDDTYSPSVAVQPKNTEQLQEILRLANAEKIPVWTHSQGKEQRLWRSVTPGRRLDQYKPPPHEPDPGNQ
ncbi:hypothetical protein [Arthrobacter sp. UCD-GKA]|uniref:hypothetical protein n=1 Tax=Arthrobacter sp. UCD-GKA TaxID=1913576 RepID=UPI00256FE781|nr:hypothetical protein [Arthrobacter sp. UCD-GKA]